MFRLNWLGNIQACSAVRCPSGSPRTRSISTRPPSIFLRACRYSRRLSRFQTLRTLDPYGRATVEALKGGWPRALAKGLPITADDALSSWSAVEYGFGIPAYGFTGKSQICTNIGNGGESYEDGSFHHEYVYGKDYVTALAWTGLKLNQLSNGAVVARTTQAENAVNAFISFLSQASVTVPNHTPGGGGGTTTLDGGKTGLGQSCLKTTR